MKDIHEVLRQKQAKYAQLGKQIEMLQQAAEKTAWKQHLLLAENDDDDNGVLAEVDDTALQGDSMSAKAGAGSGSSSASKARPAAPLALEGALGIPASIHDSSGIVSFHRR